ncbi:Planctomycete cytochrome C [Crateriforma conspicua]|uniref:Planctomycete cytochrome C n=2 Tax=Crateriforma conspicua TaxID=2527996 RepID=A0A5C6FPS0_9PLAN|nr:Planctomycete cytochrome C [Crateriforma conspicua]
MTYRDLSFTVADRPLSQQRSAMSVQNAINRRPTRQRNKRMRIIAGQPFCWLWFVCVVTFASLASADDIRFSRDVLPVLSDRCFHCHGPDESNREADLRLDIEDAAKEDRGGYSAIAAGDLEASEIWLRITTDDESIRMPPADSHRKPLTASERDSIRDWIMQGAKWGKHWSLEPIVRPRVPPHADHPVDAFVIDKLQPMGWTLSQPASARTQLRRLSFDLTGLAPCDDEVRALVDASQSQSQSETDAAWNEALDRIFASPAYAERMAMWWLDAARYSDSDGYQQDATRQNWPWRDWVIRQFQRNRSFKDFTIEQFAGDLLPNATDEQRLATCFHRNHMTNGEGGRDPEESRVDYVIDRVNTTGTVWLGLTLGCVQCHSHKFDPISQHDYYAMAAFFDSIDEDGKAGMSAKPYLDYTSPDVQPSIDALTEFVRQCEDEHHAALDDAQTRFESHLEQLSSDASQVTQAWWDIRPRVQSSEGTEFRIESDHTVQTHGPTPEQDDYRVIIQVPDDMPMVTGFRVEIFPHQSHVDGGFTRTGNGEFTLTSVLALGRRNNSPAESQLELAGAVADFEPDKDRKSKWDRRYANIAETLNDDARDGWTTEGAKTVTKHVGVYELAQPWIVQPGDQFVVVLRQRSTHGDANIGRFRIALASERGETVRRTDGDSPIAQLHRTVSAGDQITDELRDRLRQQFLLGDTDYQTVLQRLQTARSQLAELKNQAKPRKVMVLRQRDEPRDTHVLVRGVWDAKGDIVQPAVLPSVLPRPADSIHDRLDLARWIVDPENPLTPRVVVNHLWQIMFGAGLVRTPEDFGLQGERPTHDRLLDYLAVELIESDWNVQHILRLIATSDTYRQSSVVSPEQLAEDPENRLLSRASRYRLPAWMIRDNALHVAKLLNTTVGGPPVMPYQPDGVWAEITMGRFDYQHSLGPAQYRRTIYAFWRRSSAPTFLFDSAQRRVCEVGVRRTNTPLQALTLMNDTTMLEASREMADQIVAENKSGRYTGDPAKDVQRIASAVLSRRFDAGETAALVELWHSTRDHYLQHPDQAIAFCTVGQQPPPRSDSAASTAAWMTVASLILNLDEAMTRE